MNRIHFALLAVACCNLFGCSAKPPPGPPEMTEERKAAIAEEDSRIRAEESKR